MNIVLCADHGVLPGLHVAAFSLLERISPKAGSVSFSIFSDALNQADMALVHQTLAAVGKPFTLELRHVDPSLFAGFPPLNGSWATYYRLFATQAMNVDRFLYVDVDTLCDIDLSTLDVLNMDNKPAALVPEAPLALAADRKVAEQLGNSQHQPYFNAGVLLVNVKEWQRQQVTERALEYLKNNKPAFWDQSALNFVLHNNSLALDAKFNCIANMRKNWPLLNQPYGKIGRLIHFLDYPKPWDLLGEWLHPQYQLWRAVLNQTTMRNFRSWHATPTRKFPQTAKARIGYKNAVKDRMLFTGYALGWLKNVKGVPPQ